ncbi:MAG: 16S rRNA (uracil(1498)-N(3))-methyltransferase [Gammaproteobacteria bacterium]|nr:16S rRNA (uracil(1498)-N(3))-methyltransferase [Gammaproteobacteria bacterium]
MRITRIYSAEKLIPGVIISLENAPTHYLMRVLRARVGDSLLLFDGSGGDFKSIIHSISKKEIQVKILEFIPKIVESPLKIHLVQGIAKGDKMDFIIQKAVELGVTEITPLCTEYTQSRLPPEREAKRLAHWQGVIVSACEQSARTQLPILNEPIRFADWMNAGSVATSFMLTPGAPQSLLTTLRSHPTAPTSIALLIGPEGGFSPVEIAASTATNRIPVSLGPRILRTETASIVALSIIQAEAGDL